MTQETLYPSKPLHSVVLCILGDVVEGSPNQRLHWRVRAELDSRWQQNAAVSWLVSREAPFSRKVTISFQVYRGRQMDYCNVVGSRCLKAIIDGLKGRAFQDDSPKYLRWGCVQQITGKQYKHDPMVVVTMEECDAD